MPLCSPIHSVGTLRASLASICAAMRGIPTEAWEYRSDPESDKTRVVRAGQQSWPIVATQVECLLQEASAQYFPPGNWNRVVLSCVPAGEQILPHVDNFGPDVQSRSVHCHIPLVTHPDVIMGYGTEGNEVHLHVGHLYILDATQRHYVRNPSSVDRIHLLFAYFPFKPGDLPQCYISREEA